MTTTCQRRFIGGNKRTPQVQDGDSEGGCVQGGQGYMGTLYFLLNFTVNLKLL